MAALTVTEMTDILFQRSSRITAGLLESQSWTEKLSDIFLTASSGHLEKGRFLQLTARNKIVFYDNTYQKSKVHEEHPQSFRKALLELKAHGFSIPQVNAINDSISLKFWFTAYDEMRKCTLLLPKLIERDYPGTSQMAASKAFLGMSFVARGDFGRVALSNNCFSPETENLAYGHIHEHLAYHQKHNPGFFIPQGRS